LERLQLFCKAVRQTRLSALLLKVRFNQSEMLCWTTIENERALKESQGSVKHLTQFAAMIGVWGAFIAFIISVTPLDAAARSCRIERQHTSIQRVNHQRVVTATTRSRISANTWESAIDARRP